MRRFIFCLSVLVALTACTKDAVRDGSMEPGYGTVVSFGSSVREMSPATRSAYIESSFDDAKITGLTVAVYDHQTGVLSQKRHISSGFGRFELELREGGAYDLFALANMGDQTANVPVDRDAMERFAYNVPSYSSVNERGIPMTGSILDYRVVRNINGSVEEGVFDMRRLFAKVTLNVTAEFDGGTSRGVKVTSLKVCNGNGLLHGFEDSRLESAEGVILSEDYASNSSVNASNVVFYVPENRQGTIGSATSSRYKNPDNNPAVNNMRDFLTYVDVTVEAGSDYYSGTIHYRSYIGENATDNFDVKGNHAYVWNMFLTEDGLAYDDWKIEQDITDGRYLRFTRNPVLVEPGEDVWWSDFLSTNIRWEDMVHVYSRSIYKSYPNALGFTVMDNVAVGTVMECNFYPERNYSPALDDVTDIRVVSRTLEFDEDMYQVDPRKTVDSKVIYSNSHSGRETGLGGLEVADGVRWTVAGPSALPQSLLARAYCFTSDDDVVSWTPSKYVRPGDYRISVSTVDGRHGDEAVLRVNDTRWVNTDRAYGGFPRETSVHKSAMAGTYTWNVGYAYGDRSESDSDDMTSESPNSGIYAGESILADWQEHIGVRLLSSASGLVSESGPKEANVCRFSVSGETPVGDYVAEVYWKDTWSEADQDYAVRDVAVLHVTGTNIAKITIPSSMTLRHPSAETVSATVTPSDATVRKVRWEVLSGAENISVSSSGDLSASLASTAVGEARIRAVAMDGSGVVSNECVVKVVNPPYRLDVIPSSATVYNGETKAFTAICTYWDNSIRDVTSLCYWSVEDESLASIGESTGVARACASGTGTTTVHAHYYEESGSADGTATLEVKARTQISYELEVTPASVSRSVGQTQQFTATFYRLTDGVRDAGTDVTSHASWTSGTTSVATVSTIGLATAKRSGTSTIEASYVSGGQTYTGEAILIVSDEVEIYLEVTPESATKSVGETQQFIASLHTVTNGVDDGGVQVNAAWSSSSSAIATISEGGLATAKGSGTATITATYDSSGQTYTAEATLKVVDAEAVEHELVLLGPAMTVKEGKTATASAAARYYTVTYVNGVEISRTYVNVTAQLYSADSSIATTGGENGTTVTGRKAGRTYLYGKYDDLRNTEDSNIPVTVKSGWGIEGEGGGESGGGESGEYDNGNN